MDDMRDDALIAKTLEKLGVNLEEERLKTEACHLLTLFEQGKTLEEALATVSERDMREQLRPLIYDSTLRALLLVTVRLKAISPAQFKDLESYLFARSEARPLYHS
jgi:hypothetical protein